MSRSNAMSALGRMGWGVHALVYPAAGAAYQFVYKPYAKAKEDAAKQEEYDNMAKARPVDPDYFNPFTPVPFHNNPELKYAFADINLRNYVNEHHMNAKDYIWKGYNDSYDHGDKKVHTYNWSSV